MKTQINYLLLVAIGGFLFLNMFSEINARQRTSESAQTTETMPIIPNGDFEDWTNKAWTIKVSDNLMRPNYHPSASELEKEKYNINLSVLNPYHEKHCAVLVSDRYSFMNTTLENKFPISVHPSSLHGYVSCIVNDLFDNVRIKIDLLKNGAVVDSGMWLNETSLKANLHNVHVDSIVDSMLVSKSKSINAWTEITIPISHLATEIDSARITIRSDFQMQQKKYPAATAQFWVDDFFFK